MNIESAVAEFLLSCEAEGLAESTLRWYRSILGRFAHAHEVTEVRDITTHDLRSYLADLRRGEYSSDTVDDYTRALHRFWKWSTKEFMIANPMRAIRYPAAPKPKQARAASLDDIMAMFRAAKDGMSVERDQAILSFALDTGCRAEGICTLRVDDLDLVQRSAFVTEKGRKTRSVVFTPVTAALLIRWMELRENVDVVFYNPNTLESLTTSGLYHLFRRLGRRAGVKGRSNPHSFRHAFGKEWVKAGGDIVTLSRIMGHDSVEITAKFYAVFTSAEVADAHDKYSPLNKVKFGESEESE